MFYFHLQQIFASLLIDTLAHISTTFGVPNPLGCVVLPERGRRADQRGGRTRNPAAQGQQPRAQARRLIRRQVH